MDKCPLHCGFFCGYVNNLCGKHLKNNSFSMIFPVTTTRIILEISVFTHIGYRRRSHPVVTIRDDVDKSSWIVYNSSIILSDRLFICHPNTFFLPDMSLCKTEAVTIAFVNGYSETISSCLHRSCCYLLRQRQHRDHVTLPAQKHSS